MQKNQRKETPLLKKLKMHLKIVLLFSFLSQLFLILILSEKKKLVNSLKKKRNQDNLLLQNLKELVCHNVWKQEEKLDLQRRKNVLKWQRKWKQVEKIPREERERKENK